MPAEAGFGRLERLYEAMTLEIWYETLGPRLIRAAERRLGVPAETAKELLHEVVLSYLRQQGSIESERAWVMAAMRKACSGYERKQARAPMVEVLDELPQELPDEKDLEAALLAQITAREILGKLPPREGESLWLRHAEELRMRELAARLRMSVGGTEKLLRRARRRAIALAATPDEGADAGTDETQQRRVGLLVRGADTLGSTEPRSWCVSHGCGRRRRRRSTPARLERSAGMTASDCNLTPRLECTA